MVTAAIQAGGRSSRMGRDKALVTLNGIPLIELVLERIRGLVDEVLITTNHPSGLRYLNLPLIPDREPGAGALQGLLTALQAASHDHVLVLACDMPFIHRPLLKHMLSLADRADVIVPQRRGFYEPLHAVYNRQTCRPAVQAALEAGHHRVISFYAAVRVLALREDDLQQIGARPLHFFNVNSEDDLRQAERLLQEQKP